MFEQAQQVVLLHTQVWERLLRSMTETPVTVLPGRAGSRTLQSLNVTEPSPVGYLGFIYKGKILVLFLHPDD